MAEYKTSVAGGKIEVSLARVGPQGSPGVSTLWNYKGDSDAASSIVVKRMIIGRDAPVDLVVVDSENGVYELVAQAPLFDFTIDRSAIPASSAAGATITPANIVIAATGGATILSVDSIRITRGSFEVYSEDSGLSSTITIPDSIRSVFDVIGDYTFYITATGRMANGRVRQVTNSFVASRTNATPFGFTLSDTGRPSGPTDVSTPVSWNIFVSAVAGTNFESIDSVTLFRDNVAVATHSDSTITVNNSNRSIMFDSSLFNTAGVYHARVTATGSDSSRGARLTITMDSLSFTRISTPFNVRISSGNAIQTGSTFSVFQSLSRTFDLQAVAGMITRVARASINGRMLAINGTMVTLADTDLSDSDNEITISVVGTRANGDSDTVDITMSFERYVPYFAGILADSDSERIPELVNPSNDNADSSDSELIVAAAGDSIYVAIERDRMVAGGSPPNTYNAGEGIDLRVTINGFAVNTFIEPHSTQVFTDASGNDHSFVVFRLPASNSGTYDIDIIGGVADA